MWKKKNLMFWYIIKSITKFKVWINGYGIGKTDFEAAVMQRVKTAMRSNAPWKSFLEPKRFKVRCSRFKKRPQNFPLPNTQNFGRGETV